MKKKNNYKRYVQKSVTVFIHHGEDYLLLHRSLNKRIDPGRLNGIGGRVESGENYLDAAIRETYEETGYVLTNEDIKFSGVVVLEDGYAEDWDMCIFKVEVLDKKIPKGNITDDGEFIWIHKDKVLDSKYELVDDLNHYFKDVVLGTHTFFITAKLNDNEKIKNISIGKLLNTK